MSGIGISKYDTQAEMGQADYLSCQVGAAWTTQMSAIPILALPLNKYWTECDEMGLLENYKSRSIPQ